MRDLRNKLLIAALLLTMGSCLGTAVRAEVSGSYSEPATTAIKPGAGTDTGEPDSGDSGRTTQPQSGQDVTGIVLRTPSGLIWLISAMVRQLGISL